MKKAILIVLLFATCAFAQPDNPVCVHKITMCQYKELNCQWDIIDSNMGSVSYYFTELPPYTVVDARDVLYPVICDLRAG